MRLASVRHENQDKLCIHTPDGLVPIGAINREQGLKWPEDLLQLLRSGLLDEMVRWHGQRESRFLSGPGHGTLRPGEVRFLPPFRHPGKIWGIGLNYREHAADLSEKVPDDFPGSFMKPDTTIIGHLETIEIPRKSRRTTAEGELGVVIGKRCRNVSREEWQNAVAGYTCILDMTAEDILRKNPRYLTLSKSFDTFFSFGPVFVTADEIDDVTGLEVATWLNGKLHAGNRVANMTYPPDYLVSFHSAVMTLLPGDIISTGTPGATVIEEGDRVECRIDGFETLVNPVRDLKLGARNS